MFFRYPRGLQLNMDMNAREDPAKEILGSIRFSLLEYDLTIIRSG